MSTVPEGCDMTVQVVPKGTNGGVSTLGTLCGVAGGLCMGLTFWLASMLTSAKQATLPIATCVAIAVIAGVLGNLIDSILGATLQYSGFNMSKQKVVTTPGPKVQHISGYALLSNSQVNLVSSILTSLSMSGLAATFL